MGDGVPVAAERIPSPIVDDAKRASRFGQTQIGIVLTQLQSVLGAAGKHAVGLGDSAGDERSEEHTSELQSPCNLVCRLLLEKKKKDIPGIRRPPQQPEPFPKYSPILLSGDYSILRRPVATFLPSGGTLSPLRVSRHASTRR